MRRFCQDTIDHLATLNGDSWGDYWVKRRLEFSGLYNNGRIFSTCHGVGFFQHVLDGLNGIEWLEDDEAKAREEYQKNPKGKPPKLDNPFGVAFRQMIRENMDEYEFTKKL